VQIIQFLKDHFLEGVIYPGWISNNVLPSGGGDLFFSNSDSCMICADGCPACRYFSYLVACKMKYVRPLSDI